MYRLGLLGLAMILPFYDVRGICIIYDLVKLRQGKPFNSIYVSGKSNRMEDCKPSRWSRLEYLKPLCHTKHVCS